MTDLLATYVHNLDPVLLPISEKFGIRWYGFMYILGFICGFFILQWFVKIRACELRKNEVADFITLCALLGVMIGGRIGWMLLHNRDESLSNPLVFFNFLEGGMASHGGILGVTIFAFVYSRIKKISWRGLGDNLVVVSTLGVFFGRIGNFINGELYGRISNPPHKWAMKFPNELHEDKSGIPYSSVRELVETQGTKAPQLKAAVDQLDAAGQLSHRGLFDLVIAESRTNDAFREALGGILNFRHPSQLYQAAAEGLGLCLILLALRLAFKNAYHGLITGAFFILYPIARISVENVREPDSSLIMGITKGQFYSLFMFAIGAAFIASAFVKKRQNQIPDPA
ncbi:MAG: prolipoprotein diacylglyceryl transferase [Verrucomicrobiota bacterium]